jgi:hypothetical protein
MIARLAFALLFCGILSSCSVFSSSGQKTVKPRFHRGYYKKHIYHKTPHVGRVQLRLFEKQGVKTVRKN